MVAGGDPRRAKRCGGSPREMNQPPATRPGGARESPLGLYPNAFSHSRAPPGRVVSFMRTSGGSPSYAPHSRGFGGVTPGYHPAALRAAWVSGS